MLRMMPRACEAGSEGLYNIYTLIAEDDSSRLSVVRIATDVQPFRRNAHLQAPVSSSFHAHFPQFVRNMKDCWHWALVGTVVPTHTQTVPRRSPVKQCGRWSAFKQAANRSSSSPVGILYACCTAGRPYADHEAVETAMLYRFCIPPSGNDCNKF